MLPVGVLTRKPSAMAVVSVRCCPGGPSRMVMCAKCGSAPRWRRTSFKAKISSEAVVVSLAPVVVVVVVE